MTDPLKPNVKNIKKRLERFLANAGYLVDRLPPTVHERLAKEMGHDRYEAYLAIANAMIGGEVPISRLYAAPQSMVEANLLLSFQGTVVRDVNSELYLRLLEIEQKSHVHELGCWTGAFTAFMATLLPMLRFTGVDAASNAIALAQAGWSLPNLSFTMWDYAALPLKDVAKADVLLGSLPIDFDTGISDFEGRYDDGAPFETWESFGARLDEARPYFANWRQAAQPEATLLVALRLPSVLRTAAVLEAARMAGWEVRLAASRRVQVGFERFPMLEFRAMPVGFLSLAVRPAELDAWWDK